MNSAPARSVILAASVLLSGWLGGTRAWGEPSQPEGSYLADVYDAKTLGAETSTWCATQDAEGVLYIGGDRLFVNDGERWRAYNMGAAYAVRSLSFGTDGRLWAAGSNDIGWFERTTTGSWTYHSLRPQLPEAIKDLGDVWNVYPTTQGAIFVSDQRIMIWNGARFAWWKYEVPRRLISTFYRGNVYVSSGSEGLLKVTAAGPTPAMPEGDLARRMIFWMGDINNRPVIVTQGGASFVTDGPLLFPDQVLRDFLVRNILTSVQQLPDGSLALGTLKGGIALVARDLHLQKIITKQNGLPSNEIYGLFVGREGGLWVTSRSQVFRINPLSGVTLFNRRNGIPSDSCRNVILYRDQPAVVTDDHILQLSADPSAGETFHPMISVPAGTRQILSTAQGLMAAATYGVYAFNEGTWRSLYNTPADVFRIRPTDRPGVFDAAAGKKIIQFPTDGTESRELTRELPDIADDFVVDQSGRIWIGTWSKGLLVAQPNASGPVAAEPASRYGFPATEGHVRVARLAGSLVGIGPDGAWWLDPASNRFEPIIHFPSGKALAVSNEDTKGRVWVTLEGEQAGESPRIGQLVATRAGIEWQPRSIEGLAAVGVARALRVQPTKAGDVLWVAGSGGLLRVEHPEQMRAVPPPQPLLRAIARGVDGHAAQPVEGRLPYAIRRLHFEFASATYGLRDTLRYQTMLDGVDPDWSAPTNLASLDLTNLREGSYTFKVRLISNNGMVSEPTVLHFGIAPPWWRTPYAYAGCALALVLLLTGLYSLRLRTARQRALILEETVRERTQELEKANAAKTEFIASMSHEIRNPMNGIIGSVTALADTPLDEAQSEFVSTLRNCASFLASLVEDVLDFSSIEAGAFTVKPQACSPREILESVARMLAAPAAEAGTHFSITVDSALPARIHADPARIQQIVVNYATNALKFSGGGRVRLGAYADFEHVSFMVGDDGPGISTEDQAVLFTKFSRLKTARNAGVPGAGLGLAVCRAVAEQMGGTVGVASAPGRGASFFVRLPLKTAPEPVAADLPALPAMQHGARALVVEDLDYNARTLGAMLGKLGFAVDFAREGEDALRMIATGSYRVVFLDYDLPDMSGLDVARKVRARESGKARTLLIATTAYASLEDRQSCRDAGMDAFLGKPITPDKLRAILSQVPSVALPAQPMNLPVETNGIINLQMLTYLAGDTPGGLHREIKRFLDSLLASHREVIEALLARNRPLLGRAAHHVLSHARMVEAADLSALAEELEFNADFLDETALDQLCARISTAVEQIKEILIRHLPEQTPA